ncbi:MAG: tetratricopeptide repeat protein [Chitinispirillaceae bacterium]
MSLFVFLKLVKKHNGIYISTFHHSDKGNYALANSIAPLLAAELNRLQRLSDSIKKMGPVSKTEFGIEGPKILVDSPTQGETISQMTLSFSGTLITLPLNIVTKYLYRHKFEISGAVSSEEGKRVIVCYLSGKRRKRVFRINSHYGLHEQIPRTESEPLPDQVEILAIKIFSVLSTEEQMPTSALRAYYEGLRAYKDALDRPDKRNLLLLDAEHHLRESLQYYDKLTNAKHNLGLVLAMFEMNECAKTLFQKIISQTPQKTDSCIALTELLIPDAVRYSYKFLAKEGDFTVPSSLKCKCREIEMIKELILISDKENPNAYNISSYLCFLKKDHPNAVRNSKKAFTYALRRDDKGLMIDSLNIIALSLAKQGKKYRTQALDTINTAIKLDKENYYNYFLKGRVLYLLEDPSGAIEAFDKALEFNPDNMNVLAGKLLTMVKSNDAGRQQINDILRHCPSAIGIFELNVLFEELKEMGISEIDGKEKSGELRWVGDVLRFSDEITRILESTTDVADINPSVTAMNPEMEKWISGQTYAIKGRIYFNKGEFGEAYSAFDQAISELNQYSSYISEIKEQKLESMKFLSGILNNQDTPDTKAQEDPLNPFYFEAIAESNYQKGNYYHAREKYLEAISYFDSSWVPIKAWKEEKFSYRTERLYIRKCACSVLMAESSKTKKSKSKYLSDALEGLEYSSGLFSSTCLRRPSRYQDASHYWYGRALLNKGDFSNAVEEFELSHVAKEELGATFYLAISYLRARTLPLAKAKLAHILKNFENSSSDNRKDYGTHYLDSGLTSYKLFYKSYLWNATVASACGHSRDQTDSSNHMVKVDFPTKSWEDDSKNDLEFNILRKACSGIINFHTGNNTKAIEQLQEVLCHTYETEVYEHLQLALLKGATKSKVEGISENYIREAQSLCVLMEELDIEGEILGRMRKRQKPFMPDNYEA